MHLSNQPPTDGALYGQEPDGDAGIAEVVRRRVRRVQFGSQRPLGVSLVALWLAIVAFRSTLSLLAAIKAIPASQELDHLVRQAIEAATAPDSSAMPAALSELITWYTGPVPTLTNGLIVLAGIMLAKMLIEAVLAYGVWIMSERTRKLAVVWLVLSVIFVVVTLVFERSAPGVWQPLGGLPTLLSLMYLTRPEVRAAFRARWLPARRS